MTKLDTTYCVHSFSQLSDYLNAIEQYMAQRLKVSSDKCLDFFPLENAFRVSDEIENSSDTRKAS